MTLSELKALALETSGDNPNWDLWDIEVTPSVIFSLIERVEKAEAEVKTLREQQVEHVKAVGESAKVLMAERDQLKARLDDWESNIKDIMREPCLEDALHCTCVPLLNESNARLAAAIAVMKDAIREMLDSLWEKSRYVPDCTRGESATRRWEMAVSAAREALSVSPAAALDRIKAEAKAEAFEEAANKADDYAIDGLATPIMQELRSIFIMKAAKLREAGKP